MQDLSAYLAETHAMTKQETLDRLHSVYSRFCAWTREEVPEYMGGNLQQDIIDVLLAAARAIDKLPDETSTPVARYEPTQNEGGGTAHWASMEPALEGEWVRYEEMQATIREFLTWLPGDTDELKLSAGPHLIESWEKFSRHCAAKAEKQP
jgi:hypothetical protein